jgi:hypothetical protein
MWESASESTRATYEAMEAEDLQRYNREVMEKGNAAAAP